MEPWDQVDLISTFSAVACLGVQTKNCTTLVEESPEQSNIIAGSIKIMNLCGTYRTGDEKLYPKRETLPQTFSYLSIYIVSFLCHVSTFNLMFSMFRNIKHIWPDYYMCQLDLHLTVCHKPDKNKSDV